MYVQSVNENVKPFFRINSSYEEKPKNSLPFYNLKFHYPRHKQLIFTDVIPGSGTCAYSSMRNTCP